MDAANVQFSSMLLKNMGTYQTNDIEDASPEILVS